MTILEDDMKMLPTKTLKAISIAVFWLIVFGVTPSALLAQQPPPLPDSTEAQRQMVRRVHERLGDLPGGVIVDRAGKITGMGLSFPGVPREVLAERIYNFLGQNADLFGFLNPRQELVLQLNEGGVIRLGQVVNGVSVFMSMMQFNILSEGPTCYASMFNYTYPEALNVSPTPSIDSLEAGRIAQADPIHGNARTYACYYELLLSSTYDGLHPFAAGGMHLVWKFGVVGGGYQGDALYMIDAHSGQILDARCGTRY